MATTSTTSAKNQRATVFLKPSILKQTKAQAIVEESTLSQLVEKALIDYLPVKTIIHKPQP